MGLTSGRDSFTAGLPFPDGICTWQRRGVTTRSRPELAVEGALCCEQLQRHSCREAGT